MSNQKSLFIDLSQEKDVLKILPRRPLYTSSEAEWKTIQFQHHHQKAGESIPCSHPHHFIIIHDLQHTTQIEHTFDGKRQQERVNTGEISLIPAGVYHHANWNQDMNFSLLIFDPALVKRAAYESADPDRVELVKHFAKPDPLIYQVDLPDWFGIKQRTKNRSPKQPILRGVFDNSPNRSSVKTLFD